MCLGPMDVEKTMEFILRQQAKAEIRGEKADARAEKADARAEKADAQIAALRKIVQAGMRMLGRHDEALRKLEKAQLETKQELRELAAAQKETQAELKAFIRSLRRGGNGRGSH